MRKMKANTNSILLCLWLAALSGPLSGRAQTVTLFVAADTFINSGSPVNSAGGSTSIDAGTDGGGGVRRGLLRFDLSGIPSGSTITSAVVQLTVTKVPGNGVGSVDSTFDLRRCTSAWGEGTNSGNSGALAKTGDANWTARIVGTANWTVAGALSDAAATASASTPVGSGFNATYQWSGAGLVSDVQLWIGNSSQNFGWLLQSQDEATLRTVRGFAARENGAGVPTLQIGYTLPSNVPPSVSITNPPNAAVLSSSANVTINASANDTDGSVTNVQFFDGDLSLGNDATSPYTVATRLALGSHTLTAVASDNLGAKTTSAAVNVTMARYLLAITNGEIAIVLQPVAIGLAAPDYAISPPGDSNRLFVVEQNGLLRIIQNGTLLPGAALDLANLITNTLVATNPNDERGFLGLAFHPGFNNPASPGFHTLYTFNSQSLGTGPTYAAPNAALQGYKTAVNEWKISTTNANVVDPASLREIISFGKNANNHNGGTIAFGPDGYLYLGLGDGGNANDVGASHIEPGGNAQNLSTPLGKMLRLDPLNPTLTPTSPDPISANGQYRIPTTNPFQGPGQVPEIYAYGLRNPYRFAFDRANGDLILADVGQNNIEEINRIVIGGNYGWAIKEGDFLFNRTTNTGPVGTIGAPPGNRSPGFPAGLIDPIVGTLATLEYDHNDGISVTGGFVYRGAAIPELFGKYVFGDLAIRNAPPRVDGRLFYADLATGLIKEFRLSQFAAGILPNGLTVHGFGEDADGELYALVTNTAADGVGGIVYKLFPAVRLTVQVSGAILDISWPITGGRLESQTNSLSSANWVVVPGSTRTNRVAVPIDAAKSSVYYRLALP